MRETTPLKDYLVKPSPVRYERKAIVIDAEDRFINKRDRQMEVCLSHREMGLWDEIKLAAAYGFVAVVVMAVFLGFLLPWIVERLPK